MLRPIALSLAALTLAAAPALAKTPNDSGFPRQWSLNNTGQDLGGVTGTPDADVDAPEAWDLTTGSKSVKIGVVGDGVYLSQADLQGNLIAGYDFAMNDSDPSPSPGTTSAQFHDTQVATIMGAVGNNGTGLAGVNWATSLMPLKVRRDGSGARFDMFVPGAIEAAFRYAGQQGLRVVDASWGLRVGQNGFTSANRDNMLAAINASPNTLFVASAGNSSQNIDGTPRYPCSFNVPNVLCVAATDKDDKLWFSSSTNGSNYGPSSVDLAAPGARIRSTGDSDPTTYTYVNGTSYAAPIVAGVAALYFARYPDATIADVRNALLKGVDALPSLAGKVSTGGRLNARGTLAIAPAAPDTTPPPDPTVSPASGTYTGSRQVTMSDSESGASIRYTVGTGTTVPADPTATTGSVYTAPFSVSTDQVIKAAAFDAAGNRSGVVQRTYTITPAGGGGATGATDTFTRTVAAGGWGTADTGGAWTVLAQPSSFSVDGAQGRISAPSNGGERLAILGDVSVRDIDATFRVTFPDSAGTAGSFYAYGLFRRQSADGSYFRIGPIAQGKSILIRGQLSNGTSLFTNVATGLAFTPGTAYLARIQVTGASPTTLRARVWVAGTTEPTTWQLNTTTTGGPTTAGSFGLRTANDTATSTTIGIDDLAVTDLSSPGPGPGDTTPPPDPTIDPASGSFTGPQQVTMADSEAGATIRYTVGTGSTVPADPTPSTGTAYSAPFTVGSDEVIKAAAFDAAGNRSGIVQRTYTFTSPGGTPVAAQDTFTRFTPAGGWGTADSGGAWTVLTQPASFSTDGAQGLVSSPSNGGERLAILGGTSVRDVDAVFQVTYPDSAGTAGSFYSYGVFRRQSSDGSYFRIGPIAQGKSILIRGQLWNGTSLFTNVATGVAFTPGTHYLARIQVTGANPTTLRGRVWVAGTTEPSTWQLNTTTTGGPTTAGSFGFRTANDTATSTSIAFDDLTVTDLAAAP